MEVVVKGLTATITKSLHAIRTHTHTYSSHPSLLKFRIQGAVPVPSSYMSVGLQSLPPPGIFENCGTQNMKNASVRSCTSVFLFVICFSQIFFCILLLCVCVLRSLLFIYFFVIFLFAI